MTIWGLFAVCGPTLGKSIPHKISPDIDWPRTRGWWICCTIQRMDLDDLGTDVAFWLYPHRPDFLSP